MSFSQFTKLFFCISIFLFSACSSGKISDGQSTENRSPFDAYSGSVLEKLQATPQETLVPTKWDVGDTTVSNEDRLDLLIPHVQNIGGVYLGVGSEQNLTIASWAKSDFIYLMDFTEIVVNANKITVLFLKNSKQKEDFLYFWSKEGEKLAFELIQKNFETPEVFKTVYKKASPFIRKRHKTNLMLSKKYRYKMFQTDDEQFFYIRRLAQDDRILPIRGNLLGNTTFFGVGNTLKKTNLKLGILYFSNAEEYFTYPQSFKNSVLNLEILPNAKLVRTISVRKEIFPWAPGSEVSTDRGFHYAVQSLSNFQEWMKLENPKLNSEMILRRGKIDRENGITIIDSQLPK